jgi:cell division protein FtsQ
MQDFSKRRQAIRQQRQIKIFCAIWQFLAVSGATACSLWIAMGQEWHIRSEAQIVIVGNRYIPSASLQKVAPIKYPQSIFQIEPEAIARHIQTVSPVYQVVVSRRVLPAQVTIEVKERTPVAIASRRGQIGFLDREGVWMPQTSYPPTMPQPKLTVLEPRDRAIPSWTLLYQQLESSPVGIRQIDARQFPELTLSTELGLVHCGSYRSELFPQQLQALAGLRALPQTINGRPIIYLDVRDPTTPIVQTGAPPTKVVQYR